MIRLLARLMPVIVTIAALTAVASADTTPRHETADVIAARSEAKLAKEHLKRALIVQRTARKREHAIARIAKLQASLAKAERDANGGK